MVDDLSIQPTSVSGVQNDGALVFTRRDTGVNYHHTYPWPARNGTPSDDEMDETSTVLDDASEGVNRFVTQISGSHSPMLDLSNIHIFQQQSCLMSKTATL